jgi:hypothetical protein
MRRLAEKWAVLVMLGLLPISLGGAQVAAEPPPIVNVTYSTGENSDGPLGGATLHLEARRDPFEWWAQLRVWSPSGDPYLGDRSVPMGTYDLVVLCYLVDSTSVGVSLTTTSTDYTLLWDVRATASGTISVEDRYFFLWEDEAESIVIEHVDEVLQGGEVAFPCAYGP